MFKNRFHFWWVAFALCFATFLIRSPFTGFNSIIAEIERAYEFNASVKGFILSLPTFVMAILSYFVASLDRRIGVTKAIFLSIVCICIGLIFRDLFTIVLAQNTGLISILTGTVILSIGITIMTVLYPTFINSFFKKQMGIMSAINGTNISISAVCGTFFAGWMINNGYSWQQTGLLWLVITFISIIIFIPVLSFVKSFKSEKSLNEETLEKDETKIASMWLQLPAWGLAISLGIESGIFYFIISWYPSIAGDSLTNQQFIILATLFQLVSLPVSYYGPIFLEKHPTKINKVLFIVSSLFGISTILILLTSNFYLLLPIFFVFGITAGMLISVYMSLISFKTNSPNATSSLSSMSQGVAYMITSIYIFFIGISFDLFGSFDVALYTTILMALVIPLTTLVTTAFKIKE